MALSIIVSPVYFCFLFTTLFKIAYLNRVLNAQLKK